MSLLLPLVALAFAATPAPAASAGDDDDPVLRFEAGLDAASGLLDVVEHVPPDCSNTLSIDSEVAPYVRNTELLVDGVWKPVKKESAHVTIPGCVDDGCTLRYRFELKRAAHDLSDFESITEHEGNLFGNPTNWLLTPNEWSHGLKYRLEVHAPPGWTFVSGLHPAPDAADVYVGNVADLTEGPFSGFGRFDQEHLKVGNAAIEVALSGKPTDRAAIIRWVQRAAQAVSLLYGEFPVRRVAVLVLLEGGHGVSFGAAMGNGGASVIIWVGRDSTSADLDDEWTLTHEMVHLALPRVGRSTHAWLVEGLATYLEPIARAEAGQIPETDVWESFVDNLPKGEPGLFDKGFDITHSWGRTYWGGALFCFQADVLIREQTHGAKGLREAMRGVVAAGGTIEVDWNINAVFKAGDQATGTRVLEDLYDQQAEHAVDVDLPTIWKKLGVKSVDDHIQLDDSAPEALIRKAMVTPAPPKSPAR